MKRNTQLERYTNEKLSEFKNDSFKQQLLGMTVEERSAKKQSKRTHKIVFFSGLSTVVAVTVIMLCVFLIPTPNTESESKHFAEGNRIFEDILLGELNDSIKGIEVQERESYVIKKAIDMLYNEDLYYIVDYFDEEGIGAIQIVFVINKDYDYDFSHDSYNKSGMILNKQISYCESYFQEDDLIVFNSAGEIITDTVRIYITAETVSGDKDDSGFIEFVNQILKAK